MESPNRLLLIQTYENDQDNPNRCDHNEKVGRYPSAGKSEEEEEKKGKIKNELSQQSQKRNPQLLHEDLSAISRLLSRNSMESIQNDYKEMLPKQLVYKFDNFI